MAEHDWDQYREAVRMLRDIAKRFGIAVLVQTFPQNVDYQYWVIKTEKKDASTDLRLLKKR